MKSQRWSVVIVAVAVVCAVPGLSQELLLNRDFELNTGEGGPGLCVDGYTFENWSGGTPWSDASWSNISCSGGHGVYSPGFNTGSCTTSPRGELAQVVNITGGTQFRASICWAAEGYISAAALPSTVRARILLEFFSGPGGSGDNVGVEDTDFVNFPDNLANQQEAELVLEGTAPANAQSVQMTIRVDIPPGTFTSGQGVFDPTSIQYVGLIHRASYIEGEVGATPTPRCPAGTDIDSDNVCDAQEVANVNITGNPDASNRILPDSDGDGLLDGEEDINGSGLPDAGETRTRNADTDGDGYEDGLEVLFLGTDPLNANSPGTPIVDADGDGLPASIDPNDNNRDTDGDRYDDLYDALVFRDLTAASDASRVPNLGDVNGDAEAGNLDSLVIQALFLNSIDHTNPVFQAAGPGYDGFRYANPSRNGQAGNLDSLLIQAHFLGNLQTFPLRF